MPGEESANGKMHPMRSVSLKRVDERDSDITTADIASEDPQKLAAHSPQGTSQERADLRC